MEMFANHVAKTHASLLKNPFSGESISKSVREEEAPRLLYQFRHLPTESNPYTTGGDLNVVFAGMGPINLQLKTILGEKKTGGGNPVSLNVIYTTLTN